MGTPTTDNDVDKEFFASQSETRTVVTERAVSRQVDVLFRAVCDEVVLRKERVGLDLIGRLATRQLSVQREEIRRKTYRDDTSGTNDAFELSNGKVGDTNCLDLGNR